MHGNSIPYNLTSSKEHFWLANSNVISMLTKMNMAKGRWIKIMMRPRSLVVLPRAQTPSLFTLKIQMKYNIRPRSAHLSLQIDSNANKFWIYLIANSFIWLHRFSFICMCRNWINARVSNLNVRRFFVCGRLGEINEREIFSNEMCSCQCPFNFM